MRWIFGSSGSVFGNAATVAALALGLAAASVPDARAAEAKWGEGRWYVGLSVPVMFIDDTESTTKGNLLGQVGGQPAQISHTAKSTSEYKTGFKIAGTVGYELGGGFRVEGELFFARAEVDKVTYTSVNVGGQARPGKVNIPISGTADQLGGFANVWHDFQTGTEWIPFVGGGLGFIRIDRSDLKYDANALAQSFSPAPLPPGYVPELSTTETVFAYHVGGGMGYRLTDNLILQAGYRLQAASDLEFEGRNANGNVTVTSGLRVHLLEIGVRYRF